jgi:hypothetical protein
MVGCMGVLIVCVVMIVDEAVVVGRLVESVVLTAAEAVVLTVAEAVVLTVAEAVVVTVAEAVLIVADVIAGAGNCDEWKVWLA